MPTQAEIYEKVQSTLVDALGVDDVDVKPDAMLFGDLGAESIDLLARIFSMGALHHAVTGTGAVALAAAAAIPGTVVSRIVQPKPDGTVRFGHPSGTLSVGAETIERDGEWTVTKVTMSRSARRLMEGWVRVPRQ